MEAHKSAPQQIVLDLGATYEAVHGHQEDRFFHGSNDRYRYLFPDVLCGWHLLAARPRRSNIYASARAADQVSRIVGQIRARWPRVKIVWAPTPTLPPMR